jgi:hypothetical protein
MIHQGKKALLEGAVGIFERGRRASAIADDFLPRMPKPWIGE